MIALPRVIGHRGAAASAPENTLAGIARAHALGCAWVEFDVKLSFDNVPMLMHDDRLDRTTDGKGCFAERSAAELKKLDAGSWFGPGFRNERIPSLAETVKLLAHLGMGANVEIKPCPGREVDTGRRVALELRQTWPRGHGLLISSFSPAALKAARAVAPELPRGLLMESALPDWPQIVLRLGCVTLNPWEEPLRPETVAQAHALGLAVAVYTVNDPGRAALLRSWGVDSVFTDMPERLIPVIAS
jgi:glycerophosphoryl diester phosphodiesterase